MRRPCRLLCSQLPLLSLLAASAPVAAPSPPHPHRCPHASPDSPCEQLLQHHPVAVHVCGCSPARNVRVVPALQHRLHDQHTKGCMRQREACQAVRCHAEQQGMRSCKAACAAASEVSGNLAQPPKCCLRCQVNHVEAFSLCPWACCVLRTPYIPVCALARMVRVWVCRGPQTQQKRGKDVQVQGSVVQKHLCLTND